MGFLKKFIVITFIILQLPFIFADNFNSDLKIAVDNLGFTSITGITNYPNLITNNSQAYTSKKESIWLFNLSLDKHSNFSYQLELPKKIEIISINSSNNYNLHSKLNYIILIGNGNNESLDILIYYKTNKPEFPIVKGILTSILIGLIIYFIFKFSKKNLKKNKSKYDLSSLTQRQKEIMKFLIKNKKPTLMGDIVKKLSIPKTSVSRNIITLELKGFVTKENVGVSTIVKLK